MHVPVANRPHRSVSLLVSDLSTQYGPTHAASLQLTVLAGCGQFLIICVPTPFVPSPRAEAVCRHVAEPPVKQCLTSTSVVEGQSSCLPDLYVGSIGLATGGDIGINFIGRQCQVGRGGVNMVRCFLVVPGLRAGRARRPLGDLTNCSVHQLIGCVISG